MGVSVNDENYVNKIYFRLEWLMLLYYVEGAENL